MDDLRALVTGDPWKSWKTPKADKRVVTFLRKQPPKSLAFPLHHAGVTIWGHRARRAFTTYRQGEGPEFMVFLQKTFGEDITTRTWDTVTKLAR